jgi:hypothetical protein
MTRSTLSLRLDKWLEGQEVQNGAVANVYAIGTTTSAQANTHRNIVIPAGTGSAFRTIDVDPGRYLIEAHLPSGETLSQEVVVPQASPSVEVRLQGDHSPHEWLSWQHFTGNVKSRGRGEPSLDAPMRTTALESLSGDQLPIEIMRLALPPTFAGEDRSWQWRMLAEGLQRSSGLPVWPGLPQPLPGGPSDDSMQSHILDADPSLPPHNGATQDAPDLPGGRHVLWLGSGSQRELVSLPSPWLSIYEHRKCQIDVVVRKAAPGSSGFRSSIAVRDPQFGSALGFMTVGGLANAATLFGQAKEMLMYKADNPFAAAAGAYVLVSTRQGAEAQTWHQWVRNLMNWFPWLPDGAIQYGRLKLRDEASDSDLEEARQVLFEAFRRGLPFFSAGVRWLLNGITIFAEDGDAEAQEICKIVQRVSLRTDMSQPFTVVRCGPRPQ